MSSIQNTGMRYRRKSENAMKKANPDNRPLLFHCELQLLKYFIDHPAKGCQDYFGCSKRSCWLCWRILMYVGKFHTKDSHLKIYDSWAFPVPFSPEKEKLQLSNALISTYRDLISKIRQTIFAGTGFAEYEVRTETSGRAPEMAPIVTHLAFGASHCLKQTESWRGKSNVSVSLPMVYLNVKKYWLRYTC